MNKVVRLDEYRREHIRQADPQHALWACGSCGERSWTVSTSGRVCCAHCSATASNLRATESSALAVDARDDVPAESRRADSRSFSNSTNWWWTWALQ